MRLRWSRSRMVWRLSRACRLSLSQERSLSITKNTSSSAISGNSSLSLSSHNVGGNWKLKVGTNNRQSFECTSLHQYPVIIQDSPLTHYCNCIRSLVMVTFVRANKQTSRFSTKTQTTPRWRRSFYTPHIYYVYIFFFLSLSYCLSLALFSSSYPLCSSVFVLFSQLTSKSARHLSQRATSLSRSSASPRTSQERSLSIT